MPSPSDDHPRLRSSSPFPLADPTDYLALQKPLEQFRSNRKRLEIHPMEKALLWIVTFHLCALPWALGGMRLWSQIPSFVLALAGFILALIPRQYTEAQSGSTRFRLIMWPKLARFPLCWIGLALLAYVTIQALNPAWEYRTDGTVWWMRKIAAVSRLPTSVQVPFTEGGPWQMLMIGATVWLVVCSLWVGFTRRRTLQTMLIAIAVNGVALAGLGVAQKLLPNGKMFWLWVPTRDSVMFASFIYKNHAGAYLVLCLCITCGLAGWYYLRGLRRLEKSSPAGVLAFFATGIGIAVLVSYARGATIVMLSFLTPCTIAFVIHQLFSESNTRKPVVAIVLILIFGFFLLTGLASLNSAEAWTRLKQGVSGQDSSLEVRGLATRATLDMAKASWPMGAGAGSFRFLFPSYQQHYPEIFMLDGHRIVWENAHNDPVQTLAELGLPGCLLMFAAFAYLLFASLRNFAWQSPLSCTVVPCLGSMAIYSWWDFPFHNPAILLLWWTLAVAAVMWSGFEERNVRG